MANEKKDPDLTIVDFARALVDEEAQGTTDPLIQATREPVCFPHAFRIDQEARTVACRRCKREFTAFDALGYVARQWVHYEANLAVLKGDVKHLTRHRDALRKELRSLKGKVERAGNREARQAIDRTVKPKKP